MGKILEHNLYCMDSLEEKVSVFYVEDFDHETTTNHSDDEDFGHEYDDYGSDNNNNKTNELLYGQMERNLYWEAQEALLQEILERQSLTGQKLRQEVKRIIEMARETEFCSCPKPSSDGCTYCLRRILVNRLCDKGFNATLCSSKWKHTKEIPGGSHEYIEVMATTAGHKKQLSILVELEFRDQFEIVKACDGYQKLASRLPEYFIGKPECLNAIIRILCDAAKRSMKEKKIHMGPWRKRSFMEMKWSYSFDKRKSLDEKLHQFPLASPRQAHEPCLHLPTARAVVVT